MKESLRKAEPSEASVSCSAQNLLAIMAIERDINRQSLMLRVRGTANRRVPQRTAVRRCQPEGFADGCAHALKPIENPWIVPVRPVTKAARAATDQFRQREIGPMPGVCKRTARLPIGSKIHKKPHPFDMKGEANPRRFASNLKAGLRLSRCHAERAPILQGFDGPDIFGFQLVDKLGGAHAGFNRANPLSAAPNIPPGFRLLIAA